MALLTKDSLSLSLCHLIPPPPPFSGLTAFFNLLYRRERAAALARAEVDVFVIDIAHGHSEVDTIVLLFSSLYLFFL